MSITIATLAVASTFGNAHGAPPARREQSPKVEVRDHRAAAPARAPERVDIRDHRTVAPERNVTIVRDHGARPAIVDHRPIRWDRDRPVIVQRPLVTYTRSYDSAYSTGYTYQPQSMSVMGATAIDGRLDLDLTNRLASSTTLRLDAVGSGSTYINQVLVYYTNGASQVVSVEQMLSPSNPTFTLPVRCGSDVAGIAIDGHSGWNGAIAVDAF